MVTATAQNRRTQQRNLTSRKLYRINTYSKERAEQTRLNRACKYYIVAVFKGTCRRSLSIVRSLLIQNNPKALFSRGIIQRGVFLLAIFFIEAAAMRHDCCLFMLFFPKIVQCEIVRNDWRKRCRTFHMSEPCAQ